MATKQEIYPDSDRGSCHGYPHQDDLSTDAPITVKVLKPSDRTFDPDYEGWSRKTWVVLPRNHGMHDLWVQQAIQDSLTSQCHCSHDCCGHRFTVARATKVNCRNWKVDLHTGYRN